MSETQKQALYSFGRVYVAAALAQLLHELGAADNNVFSLDGPALQMIVSSGVAAAALTAVNWFRPGETRFGVVPPPPEPVKDVRKPRVRKS